MRAKASNSRLVTLMISLSLSGYAFPVELKGENCDLSAAPSSSGEIFAAVGKTFLLGRVYPRLSEIPANYTGCQVLWSSTNNGHVTRSAAFFQAGRIVSVSPVPDGVPLCTVGEKAAETGCTSPKYVVQVSYPAGCAARAMELKRIPVDCAEAFMEEFKIHGKFAD